MVVLVVLVEFSSSTDVPLTACFCAYVDVIWISRI